MFEVYKTQQTFPSSLENGKRDNLYESGGVLRSQGLTGPLLTCLMSMSSSSVLPELKRFSVLSFSAIRSRMKWLDEQRSSSSRSSILPATLTLFTAYYCDVTTMGVLWGGYCPHPLQKKSKPLQPIDLKNIDNMKMTRIRNDNMKIYLSRYGAKDSYMSWKTWPIFSIYETRVENPECINPF